MYDQYYGFTGRPFQLTPDPHYYFESATHRKAMSYLEYGLAQGEGMILITGDVGMGKTSLVGHLLSTIAESPVEQQKCHAVSLVVGGDGTENFLLLVAEKMGLDYLADEQAILLRGIEIYLRGQAKAGQRTLLVIDDAHYLSVSALEQLLLLAGLQDGTQPLLQIFLIGQPEFRPILFDTPSLDDLRQRVIATHELEAMGPEELEPYIFHRLAKAGWNGHPTVRADAFNELYAQSAGVPRRVNSLFSRVLLYAALEDVAHISGQTVRDVVAELTNGPGRKPSGSEQAKSEKSPPSDIGRPAHIPADHHARKAASDAASQNAAYSAAQSAGHGASFAGESPAMVAAAEYLLLQHRIARLEARVSEQDAAMRQMVDLLIRWIDQQDEDAEILFPSTISAR